MCSHDHGAFACDAIIMGTGFRYMAVEKLLENGAYVKHNSNDGCESAAA